MDLLRKIHILFQFFLTSWFECISENIKHIQYGGRF